MRWNKWLPWIVAILALAAYLPGLGALPLVNDAAKDALNVASPHPPLMRWIIWESQNIFGFSPFWARLPVAILGSAAAALMQALLTRLTKKPILAAVLALAFAFAPPQFVWSRSAFLSVPLAFSWMMALLGMARLEDDARDRAGYWLIAAGVGLGVWMELQGVLLVPAAAWCVWRHRAAMKEDIVARWIVVLGAAQILLVGAYVLGTPLILADIMNYRHNLTGPAGGAGKLGVLLGTPVVAGWIAASIVAAAAVAFTDRIRARAPFFQSMLLLLAPVALLMSARPTEYYLPYLIPLAVIFIALAPRICLLILAALLFLRPSSSDQSAYRSLLLDQRQELRALIADERSVGALGAYGFEVQYEFPMPVRKFARIASGREDINYWFVFSPDSLQPDEREFLSTLTRVADWGGGMATYRK